MPAERPWVGTANFDRLLACENYLEPRTCEEDLFWRSVYNTFSYVVFQVALMVLFSLITALILNRNIKARGFFRSVFFYPVLLSPIVVSLIWKWILQENGLLNGILISLGFDKIPLFSERPISPGIGYYDQYLGIHGILYAHSPGRFASHPGRFV